MSAKRIFGLKDGSTQLTDYTPKTKIPRSN